MAKVKRSIIKIDEEKCNGCGICVPSCKEGALQIIDGKARLVSEVYCDGLGACLGECPQGALEIIEKEADEFDEEEALRNIKENKIKRETIHEPQTTNHVSQDTLHASQATSREPLATSNKQPTTALPCGCPGTMAKVINPCSTKEECKSQNVGDQESELRQWPVQLHLIPVNAPYLKDSSLVLMADCTAVAYPNLHRDFIKGKSLAIACPKLDDISGYVDKLAEIIKQNNIKKIEVVMMEVPCCKGLVKIAESAVEMSEKGVVLKERIVTLEGKLK